MLFNREYKECTQCLFDNRLDMMELRESFDYDDENANKDELLEDEIMNKAIEKIPETDINVLVDDENVDNIDNYIGTPLESYLDITLEFVAAGMVGGAVGGAIAGVSVTRMLSALNNKETQDYLIKECEKIYNRETKKNSSITNRIGFNIVNRFKRIEIQPSLNNQKLGYHIVSKKYGTFECEVTHDFGEIKSIHLLLKDKNDNILSFYIPRSKNKKLNY